MERSTDRVLTTHTGSLPRPPSVVDLLLAEEQNRGVQGTGLEAAVKTAIDDVVQRQLAAGIDIISDGEQCRPDYTSHVKDRLTGYDGPSSPARGTSLDGFPELSEMLSHFASPLQYRPSCTGPISWKDWPAAKADIERAKSVLTNNHIREAFMTSPSPGQIARYLTNHFTLVMSNTSSRWQMRCGASTWQSLMPD